MNIATTGDAGLSSVLGWISIACWIVVYSPQILENYQLQSGEGLSVVFVYIWLLGDLCNLGGALLAGLLPTVIILAIYYSLCDVTLLCQIYYYRRKRTREAPLLTPDDSDDDSFRSNEPREDSPLLAGSTEEEPSKPSTLKLIAQYSAALLFVLVIGVVAYLLDRSRPVDEPSTDPPEALKWKVQLIGWTSAALYLGSRIPQIFKNFKTRCEGLSPALFLFSITGNVTYAASICAASMEREYLIRNGSWLAGAYAGLNVDTWMPR
ncbi:hypothetical protein PLICRDRAFT_177491 [Plicaturopsis crispa FD-325 SS-3]|nr:hypothetical protein PLICRDRAFT_177491 [Plicaturopsis crispa FD-325 SS-3]